MPTTGELNLNQNNNSALKDALKSTRFTPIDTEDKVISTQDIEEEKTAAVVLPIDGGWAWVVMVASFLCITVVDGIVFSSGMIQESIMARFHVSKAYVAIVSSLLSGCYLMAGPFVSALANRYGFRPVTMCGAVIASIAFGLSYFATSVEFLFISYGIIGGIGFCMIYIPSVIVVGYYFEKWRALATGIALCGSGVGTIVFGPLTKKLVADYKWDITLVVQAGIIMLCLIFGAAYRPLPVVELKAVKEEENGDVEEKKIPIIHQSAFKKPLPEGRFAYSVPSSAHNTYTGAASRNHYPTAAEIFQGVNIERKLSGISGKCTEMKSIRKSQPTTPNGIDDHKFDLKKELNTVGEIDEDVENQNLIEDGNELQMIGAQGRRHTVSGRRPADLTKSHNRLNKVLSGSRPLYRDDAFYLGSLAKIPQYTSQTSLGYHMSVTRVATKKDIIEEEESTCKLCPEAVRRTLSTMLDTSLLKSPSFMLLSCSGFLTMMGFFVPFIFMIERLIDGKQMTEDTAVLVFQAIGISNTIARIVCGLLSSFPSVSALMLNNVAITIGGIFTIFSGVSMSAGYQFTFAAIFGICIACFSALRSIIAVELMGLEKLTNAFGFLMLFQGLAAAVGGPIAGVFYDKTKSYDASFYFAGGLITLSAFFCYPLRYVSAWEKRRDEEKQKSATASP